MGSATAHALAKARAALVADAGSERLDFARGLFLVADTLGESAALRGVIADPSTDERERTAVINRLFTGRAPEDVVAYTRLLAGLRWSSADELVESVEELGDLAVARSATATGRLERLEDELFDVAQVFAGSRELQLSLSHPGEHPDAERRLVERLFGDRALPETVLLTERAVRAVRGSMVARRLDDIAERVSATAGRRVALATAATPLTESERTQLARALEREAGGPVHVNVAVDPALVGGVVVCIGDVVIDSSARTKLAQLRQAIA